MDEPSPSGGSFSSGYSTCYTYDGFGHALQVTQGTQTRTYTYDSSERLTKAVTPESGTVNYYYSSGSGLCSGNINLVCKMTDARSISTTYFYDALGRLTIKEYSDSTPWAYFYYDESSVWGVSPTNPVGRLTLATANSNGTVFSYDAKGRINETWQVNGSVDKHELYTWNYDGSLSSITYPSGRVVNYAVGNAGRATSATDGSGYQYAAPQGGSWPEYAAFGPLETMTNGAVSGGFAGIANYSTWANGIPRLVLYGESAVVGGDYIMNYANFPLNNLNFEAVWDDMNLNRSQTYTYDYLQRITSAVTTGTSGGDCWGQGFGSGGYSYDDRYSNLSQMTVTQCSAGSLDEAITSSTNQFTGFAYDNSGNETGGIGTQTYDAENRMSTSGYPGFTLTNAFDALNLKITKTRSDGLYPKMYWRDIWGNTLSESDSSGHMLNDYVYFAGKRIAYVTNTGSTYFYLTDQIGSVRKIADQNGVVCYDADYTPYGQQIYVASNSCPAQPYLFAGMERDDNAFDYDFARYYSSRLGRFMSADPLGGSVDNPQSLNRYAYVENNPINLTDPSGMYFCVPVGAHSPPACDPHAVGGFGDDPESTWVGTAMAMAFGWGPTYNPDPVNNPNFELGGGEYDPIEELVESMNASVSVSSFSTTGLGIWNNDATVPETIEDPVGVFFSSGNLVNNSPSITYNPPMPTMPGLGVGLTEPNGPGGSGAGPGRPVGPKQAAPNKTQLSFGACATLTVAPIYLGIWSVMFPPAAPVLTVLGLVDSAVAVVGCLN